MTDFYCALCDQSFDFHGTSNEGLDMHLTEVHGRQPNADNGKGVPKLGQNKSLKSIDDRPEINRFQNMIRSGREFENDVEEALKTHGFFTSRPNEPIGERVEGSGQKPDVLAWRTHRHTYVFSCKRQDRGGTAEQKLVKEAIDLQYLMDHKRDEFEKAYVVLGGSGFTELMLRWLISAQAKQYIRIPHVEFLWFGLPFYPLKEIKGFNEVVEKLE